MSTPNQANALVFKPTRACPARCDFCCDPVEASGDRLRREHMIRLVEQVSDAIPGMIHMVGFTGGEPFLLFDDILAVCQTAHRRGLTSAVVSSSYWAKTPAIAREQLAQLQAAGLTRYSTSCDDEHLRFVPIEAIRNALTAACDLGLDANVVGTFATQGRSAADLIGEPLASRVRSENKLIAPYGRAAQRPATVADYAIKAELDHWRCYRRIGHDILVQPNGDVLPCCSTNNMTNPLIFGNILQGDDIAEVVLRILESFLLRLLKFEGFSALQTSVDRHAQVSWPIPEHSSGPCGYCAQVFNDPDRASAIFLALAKEQPGYLSALLEKAGLPSSNATALLEGTC